MRVFLGVTAFMMMLAVGCKEDKARANYSRCLELAARGSALGDLVNAAGACTDATKDDPTSKSGIAARAKLSELEPAIEKAVAERDRAAAEKTRADEAALQANKARYKGLPTILARKIRDQGMRDMVRGGETLVIDMITRDVGEPDGVFEGAYGTTKYYVWGAKLDSPSRDAVHAAPFSAGMIRNLTAGDYAENSVEFYSYGERIRP